MELKYSNASSRDIKPPSPLSSEAETATNANTPGTSHILVSPRSSVPVPGSQVKSEEAPRADTSQIDTNTCSMLADKMIKQEFSFDGTSDPLSVVEEQADTELPTAIQQDHNRIRAQVTVEGRSLTATLDTGVLHSFISERLARELDNGTNLRAVLVKLADGTGRQSLQALRASIQLGEARVSICVLIMADVLDDLRLGMDFLCYSTATLQCGGLALTLRPPTQVRSMKTLPATDEWRWQFRQASFETGPNDPDEGRPENLPIEPRRLQAPLPVKEELASDEEQESLVRAPDGWVTENGWVPAELMGRIQERIRQAPGRSLRYLEDVGENRYRIQVARQGEYVRVVLHPRR